MDIDDAALKRTVDSSSTAQIHPYVMDLGEIEALHDLVEQVRTDHGPVSILVNVTGGPPPGPISNIGPTVWRHHVDSLVLPVITLTDLLHPGMRERGWGRVITSASSGVVAPIPNLGISNTLRSALVGWSKTLANEVGRFGITANVVLPGRIATQRIMELDNAKAAREQRLVSEVRTESMAGILVGRYGEPS